MCGRILASAASDGGIVIGQISEKLETLSVKLAPKGETVDCLTINYNVYNGYNGNGTHNRVNSSFLESGQYPLVIHEGAEQFNNERKKRLKPVEHYWASVASFWELQTLWPSAHPQNHNKWLAEIGTRQTRLGGRNSRLDFLLLSSRSSFYHDSLMLGSFSPTLSLFPFKTFYSDKYHLQVTKKLLFFPSNIMIRSR